MFHPDLDLLEELSNNYIAQKELPPLAAKVYALLLLDVERTGLSFDELVEFFQTSKSSISNALQVLLQAQQIESFNKIDCRKRFFRINGTYLLTRYQRMIEKLEQELILTERYLRFTEAQPHAQLSVKQRLKIKNNAIKLQISNLQQTYNDLKEIK